MCIRMCVCKQEDGYLCADVASLSICRVLHVRMTDANIWFKNKVLNFVFIFSDVRSNEFR